MSQHNLIYFKPFTQKGLESNSKTNCSIKGCEIVIQRRSSFGIAQILHWPRWISRDQEGHMVWFGLNQNIVPCHVCRFIGQPSFRKQYEKKVKEKRKPMYFHNDTTHKSICKLDKQLSRQLAMVYGDPIRFNRPTRGQKHHNFLGKVQISVRH